MKKRVCKKFKETRAGRRCAKFGKPRTKYEYGKADLIKSGYVFDKKGYQRIVGKLRKTERKVYAVRKGLRREYIDDSGQRWVNIDRLWWRFPQEVEY